MGFPFIVEIDGVQRAGFSEATGVEAETEIEDRQEGGQNDYTHRLAKHTKYTNISLKRGITDDEYLWNWHQDVVAGQFERRSISVVLKDISQQKELWHWEFRDAWPVKWSGSGLNASTNGLFVEAVDFAHHGLTKVRA